MLIGVLAELSEDGQPKVDFPGNLAVLPICARCTTSLNADAIGSQVALLFENGDIRRPLIVGVVQALPDSRPAQKDSDDQHPTPASEPVSPSVQTVRTVQTWHPDSEATDEADSSELIIDGQRIDLTAREQITLRCGKASITMTRAGKVIIRGTYVSSKSSGANRIKGGSVQIN